MKTLAVCRIAWTRYVVQTVAVALVVLVLARWFALKARARIRCASFTLIVTMEISAHSTFAKTMDCVRMSRVMVRHVMMEILVPKMTHAALISA